MTQGAKQFFLQNKSLLEQDSLDELYEAAVRSKFVSVSDVTDALLEAGIDPMLQVSKIYDLMYYTVYAIPLDIKIPDRIDFIGIQAFMNTPIHHIDCNKVDFISPQAFHKCLELEKIEIPNVERIEEGAFYRTAVREITFRDGPCVVEEGAFTACNSLQTINITKYTNISSGAFTDCSGVEKINFNGTKHEFYESHVGPAFRRDWYSQLTKVGAKIICTDGAFGDD